MTAAPGRSLANAQHIEVDAGVGLPVAYTGLRKILGALGEVAPEVVRAVATARPAEWNRLFPGAVAGAPDLADLALTPSERRLHRESEQTFLVLNVGAKAVLDALKATGRRLVVRNAGACDLVSLRCLMRAAEWGRLEGVVDAISLADCGARRAHAPKTFEARHRAYLETLRQRMWLPEEPLAEIKLVDRAAEAPVDFEGRFLAAAVSTTLSPERRIAAAILSVRSAFFTTNYEGALLAAEHALALLRSLGPSLDRAEVLAGWDALAGAEGAAVTPAIEIDRESLGDRHELLALIHRCIGVVQVFTGQHEEALESFAAGLACDVSPETRGQMHMFRGLMLIKRLGQLGNARAEILAGLKGLEGRTDALGSLHQGWLRNVLALSYFQEKNLDQAVVEEKAAIRCVGDLHDPSATHLKINLISNLSVVQETAKRFDDAINTWRRFEKISENWGVNFHKHHRFRLAGLTLGKGDRAGAAAWYKEAYASAEQLNDSLHRQAIASEIGKLMLEGGDATESSVWYGRALAHAREIGDPFKVAESLVGEALASGSSEVSHAAPVAALSTTYPKEAKALAAAAERGAIDELKRLLPSPRSKLNRPFDLVNL